MRHALRLVSELRRKKATKQTVRRLLDAALCRELWDLGCAMRDIARLSGIPFGSVRRLLALSSDCDVIRGAADRMGGMISSAIWLAAAKEFDDMPMESASVVEWVKRFGSWIDLAHAIDRKVAGSDPFVPRPRGGTKRPTPKIKPFEEPTETGIPVRSFDIFSDTPQHGILLQPATRPRRKKQ